MSTEQDIQKLKDLILDVAEDVPEIYEGMNEAEEWNSIGEIMDNIKVLSTLIQQLGLIAKLGKDMIGDIDLEDDEIVNAISEIINEKIDLPWIPEAIEATIFSIGVKMVLGFVDDLIDKGGDVVDKMKSKVSAKIN